MKRILVALLLVCLSASSRAEDWIVQAGTGVGPVKLGMALKETERLGLIRKDTVTNGRVIAYTKYGGLEIEWGPRAIQIVVNSTKTTVSSRPVGLRADGNIQIGSTLSQVEAAYGRNYLAQPLKTGRNEPAKTHYIYKDKGIGFIVSPPNASGKVISMNIWIPAR